MKYLKISLMTLSLFVITNIVNAQIQLDVSGDIIIRDNTPSLTLYDAAEERNEFTLSEANDNILLQSLLGNLEFRTVTGGGGISTRLIILGGSGNIGIGTSTPDEPLSFSSSLGPKINLFDDSGIYGLGMAPAELQIGTFDNTKHISLGHYSGSSKTFVEWVEINSSSLVMTTSGAYVTAGGVWIDASSRSFKENISDLTLEEATLALAKLKPVKFNYKLQKDEEYIGFIAEDVPELVSMRDRKGLSPMDIVAMLTRVVQKQQSEIADLKTQKSEVADLKLEMAALKSLLNAQIKNSEGE